MYKFDTELALNSIKRSNEVIKTDSMVLFVATRVIDKTKPSLKGLAKMFDEKRLS